MRGPTEIWKQQGSPVGAAGEAVSEANRHTAEVELLKEIEGRFAPSQPLDLSVVFELWQSWQSTIASMPNRLRSSLVMNTEDRDIEIGRSLFREANDAFFLFDPRAGRDRP